jgi:hypothetical protein
MKVPYVEDLANHSSPESCGWYSNGLAEALTGESVGRLLSSEITTLWVPTTCTEGEGHADGSAICGRKGAVGAKVQTLPTFFLSHFLF